MFFSFALGSGAVALAHLDGTGIDEAISTMVARVQTLAIGYPEGRIELQLIGGYKDQQNYAEDLFVNIMRKYRPASINNSFLYVLNYDNIQNKFVNSL